MHIKEICTECSLTKKAVEYYIRQGLVQPAVEENGYRSFSSADVKRLKKISMLRQLGLSAAEIRIFLDSSPRDCLSQIAHRKKLQLSAETERLRLLELLAEGASPEIIQPALCALEAKQSVLERMLAAFPGFYGRYMTLHFAPFLSEPMETQEQQNAFRTVTEFLDGFTLDIPPELDEFFGEIAARFDEDRITGMDEGIKAAVKDASGYISANRQNIEEYMAYRSSDEYRSSPAFALWEHLKKRYTESGYYSIFIPAMRKLSSSYNEYSSKLDHANQAFLQEYPDYPI